MKEHKRAFNRFLKYNSIYDHYYDSFNRSDNESWRVEYGYLSHMFDFFERESPDNWISMAFCWQHSGGDEFWGHHNGMWNDVYYNEDSKYYKPLKLSKRIKTV
jgi:hypothetical protein